MLLEDMLGRVVTLFVCRFDAHGAELVTDLADASVPELLLPGAQIPEGAQAGDALEVCVYLDSEDRPIATTQRPLLLLGEVGFLEVVDVMPFGAFVDWGLAKHLLVPKREQTRDLAVGERHPVGLYIDDTGRLAGTMRVAEMLGEPGDFVLDSWVVGEAWRNDPELGVFVIVERRCVGLLPVEQPTSLTRGQRERFRIADVLADGKITLSLRGWAADEIDSDAERVLSILSRGGPPASDKSSPEEIRARFGLSKKAFKRAAGRLLRDRRIATTADGWFTVC